MIACICLGWIPVINFLIGFYVPIFGKYLVIKLFEKALDMNNEMVFNQMSGVAKWAIYVGIAVPIVAFIIIIIAFSILGSVVS
ncbi:MULTISPECIES: hypothetical protein [Campylobacter]|uniref:hypothetical protein n=1 Tax=Campylobacter TaxID=194 RepID=UPI000A3551A3|nr:hypothetical protein [Campylobacter sp. P0024]MCR8679696.1 hypothetical protein [Campylobacter sp. RM19072]